MIARNNNNCCIGGLKLIGGLIGDVERMRGKTMEGGEIGSIYRGRHFTEGHTHRGHTNVMDLIIMFGE